MGRIARARGRIAVVRLLHILWPLVRRGALCCGRRTLRQPLLFYGAGQRDPVLIWVALSPAESD